MKSISVEGLKITKYGKKFKGSQYLFKPQYDSYETEMTLMSLL